MLEQGVFDIPLVLDPTLEPLRPELQASLVAAQRRLAAFASRYGWDRHVNAPFARQAHIYAEKERFDHDLLTLCGLDPEMVLPDTYCAALEQQVLLCVSPALYRQVYPEGDEPAAYEKLITHEMAHRLHIRVLDGDEEAMGPVWFYEGFAIYAAGQFEHTAPDLTMDEIWNVVHDPKRGSYRQYATVFRHFLNFTDLHQLVTRAGKADLIDWLTRLVHKE